MILQQFGSLTIFLLQIIDYNQQSEEIVRTALSCFKVVVSAGKVLEPEASKKILEDILNKSQLKTSNSLMQAIMINNGHKSRDQLLDDLNRDYYTLEIEIPLRVNISDKFLIQTEKYLKVLR